MGKITYADEIDARFGVPWTDDFKYDRGELKCALSDEEIDKLTVQDPVRAETLTRLLLDQPNSEKEDPIEWGWTLPGWRRVMDNWKDTKIHVCLGGIVHQRLPSLLACLSTWHRTYPKQRYVLCMSVRKEV